MRLTTLLVLGLLFSSTLTLALPNKDILCSEYGYRYRVLSIDDREAEYDYLTGYDQGTFLRVLGDWTSLDYHTSYDRVGVLAYNGRWNHYEITGQGTLDLPRDTNFIAFCTDHKARRHKK